MKYIFNVLSDKAFWCYSDLYGFEYLVELEYSDDFEKARKIAEAELNKCCDPDNSNDPEYYFYVGYIEVVQNALLKAGIKANYYIKWE